MTAPALTVDDLLAFVAIARGQKWRVGRFDLIRNEKGECPICAACNAVEDTGFAACAYGAMKRTFGTEILDASYDARIAVQRAADERLHPLRPALMHALGMTR